MESSRCCNHRNPGGQQNIFHDDLRNLPQAVAAIERVWQCYIDVTMSVILQATRSSFTSITITCNRIQTGREIQNAISGHKKDGFCPKFLYIQKPALLPVPNIQKYWVNAVGKVSQKFDLLLWYSQDCFYLSIFTFALSDTLDPSLTHTPLAHALDPSLTHMPYALILLSSANPGWVCSGL